MTSGDSLALNNMNYQHFLFPTYPSCITLFLSLSHSPQVVEQMSFLIRAEDSIITEESFRSSVQFGSVRGGAIEGLLRLMNGIHTPQVTLNTVWPETAKNNYSVELHRFITKLTGNDR